MSVTRLKGPTTRTKLGLLLSLYFAQGLPFGFFTQALPVMMRQAGYSLRSVGLSSLLAFPWALKFLWAPAVDRLGSPAWGRRKSWIVPLQLLAALTLWAVGLLLEPHAITPILAVVFVVNLLAATQDIATDGLAVDILAPAERGLANGVQVAGYRLGMIVGGGLLLLLFGTIGWRWTFLAMGFGALMAVLPILWVREPQRLTGGDPKERHVSMFLRRPDAARIITMLSAYKLADHFASGMLRPLLVDRGFDLTDIGWMLGTAGFVAGLVGALTGGALVNPLGRRRALLTFATLAALGAGLYIPLALDLYSIPLVYLVASVEHFAGGMATAALFTCMMDFCDPRTGATDYTLQASVVVIASGAGSALSGFSAQSLGYPLHFAAATTVYLLAVVLVAVLFPPSQG